MKIAKENTCVHPLVARLAVAVVFGFLAIAPAWSAQYVPSREEWHHKTPSETGFNAEKLAAAVAYAREKAVTEPQDLYRVVMTAFAPREPNFRILGPTRPRQGDSGMIIRHGYVVAQWGDTKRADMTFSVAKSYLSTMAALALNDGLIQDVDDEVSRYVNDGKFEGNHNGKITWRHLLQQTSDWSGTLWDVADWADRPEGDDPAEWSDRVLHEPGTHFKYNDVRVNLLAYALLQVHRRPLPQILRERIMDPIGASHTWEWHGYENSWVTVDGLRMQSVSGGGHFGGGLFISTEDHARFGLLFLQRGAWGERRLLPESWIDELRRPAGARSDYGYMWWLNTSQKAIPAAPESAYWAAGFGGNYIYVDEVNDLVIVLRWIPDLQGVVERVLAALN